MQVRCHLKLLSIQENRLGLVMPAPAVAEGFIAALIPGRFSELGSDRDMPKAI